MLLCTNPCRYYPSQLIIIFQRYTFPMHIVNLFFHLCNIVLVYRFTQLLIKNNTAAILISLCFAIHPMNAEAVDWISARSSGMYTFFYLFSLIQYIKYLHTNNQIKHLVICCLFFILSLLTKAQAVTLPVILILIDFYYSRKLWNRNR